MHIMIKLKNHYDALETASIRCCNDKEIVMAAVQQYGYALEHASEMLKNDKDIVLAAVTNVGYSLEYAGETLKHDKDIVFAAVTNYGGALEFAGDILKNDQEIVTAAVHSYSLSLEWASEELKNHKEIVTVVARQEDGPEALKFASEALRQNQEILRIAAASPDSFLNEEKGKLREEEALSASFGFLLAPDDDYSQGKASPRQDAENMAIDPLEESVTLPNIAMDFSFSAVSPTMFPDSSDSIILQPLLQLPTLLTSTPLTPLSLKLDMLTPIRSPARTPAARSPARTPPSRPPPPRPSLNTKVMNLLPSRMQGMRVISATEEVHEEMKEEMEITVRRTRMVSPNAAFVARKDWNARYMSHERTVSKFT